MAVVTAEIRFAPKLTAWFTANPTLVLQDGEIVYCSDGANIGKYVIGDNSTTLNNLVFYGGVSASGLTIGTTTITGGTNTRILYNNSGVVGEYTLTGTGTVVAMQTSPQFITPNIGVATGTSLIVGGGTNIGLDLGVINATTPIIGARTTSATSYAQLYLSADNTSRATSIKHTSSAYVPSDLFSANSSIFECYAATVAFINGVSNGNMLFATGGYLTSNKRMSISSGGLVNIGNATDNGTAFGILRVGQGSSWLDIGESSSATSIWFSTTPTASNYGFRGSSSSVVLNASSNVSLYIGTGDGLTLYTNRYTFNTNAAATTGNITTYLFTPPANTGQTAGSNSPTFKVTGNTKTKATGADSLQYFNWWTSHTIAYNAASTLTLGANSVFEYMQGGTNATVTTSCAIYVPTLALTNTTNGIGILVNAPTGGTASNLTAKFQGGSTVTSGAVLATTATDGFLYLPSCAGLPTGVPTAQTGTIPIVIDSTNNKAYIYSGGAWVALN